MTIWTRRSPPTALPEGSFETHRWSGPVAPPPGLAGRFARLARRRLFALTVLLPTALAAVYFFAFAAPQYHSEARFLVRARQAAPTGGFAEMLAGAGFSRASEDALGIRDYLGSHDAIAALRQRLDLIGIYRRPEADALARLWWEEPSAERLLDYVTRMAQAEYDATSGITVLRVKAFRAEDAQTVAATLIGLAEEMVNRLNARLLSDGLRVARDEVARAEARVTDAQAAMTGFRERERAPDPGRTTSVVLAEARDRYLDLTKISRP